jgi:hypothetical protein
MFMPSAPIANDATSDRHAALDDGFDIATVVRRCDRWQER